MKLARLGSALAVAFVGLVGFAGTASATVTSFVINTPGPYTNGQVVSVTIVQTTTPPNTPFDAVTISTPDGCLQADVVILSVPYVDGATRTVTVGVQLKGIGGVKCTLTATDTGGTKSILLPSVLAEVVTNTAPSANKPVVSGVSVGSGTLPRTGQSSLAQVWLGTILLGVGTTFVVFARVRRRATVPVED